MPHVFFPLRDEIGFLISCNDLQAFTEELRRLRDTNEPDPYEGYDWDTSDLDIEYALVQLHNASKEPSILVFDEIPQHTPLELSEEGLSDLIEKGKSDTVPSDLIAMFSLLSNGTTAIACRAH